MTIVGVLDEAVDDGAADGCDVDDGCDVPVDDRTTADAVEDERATDAVDDDRCVAVEDGVRITLAVEDRGGVVEPLNVATGGPVKKNAIDESYSLR